MTSSQAARLERRAVNRVGQFFGGDMSHRVPPPPLHGPQSLRPITPKWEVLQSLLSSDRAPHRRPTSAGSARTPRSGPRHQLEQQSCAAGRCRRRATRRIRHHVPHRCPYDPFVQWHGRLVGGTLTFTNASSVGGLVMNGGQLDGTGNLVVTGTDEHCTGRPVGRRHHHRAGHHHHQRHGASGWTAGASSATKARSRRPTPTST